MGIQECVEIVLGDPHHPANSMCIKMFCADPPSDRARRYLERMRDLLDRVELNDELGVPLFHPRATNKDEPMLLVLFRIRAD
jgi:hypothetical protein